MSEKPLEWPHRTFLLMENHRLVVCPVAKNACTSLKRLVLRLSNIACRDEAIAATERGGIHRYLVDNATGLMLRDIPLDKARAILADKNYKKFTLLRNPYNRAASGYLQKFVTDRGRYTSDGFVPLRNTKPVIDWVYAAREEPVDYETSITFREFVDYLCNNDDHVLDTHWKPQVNYLADVDFDFIGCIERMDEAIRWLNDATGGRADMEHVNRLETRPQPHRTDKLSTLRPTELLRLHSLPALHAILTEAIKQDLRKRYAADFDVYERHCGRIN